MKNKYIYTYDDFLMESKLFDFFRNKWNALKDLFKNSKFLNFLKKQKNFSEHEFKSLDDKGKKEYMRELFPKLDLTVPDDKKYKNYADNLEQKDTLYTQDNKTKHLDKNTEQYRKFLDSAMNKDVI